MRRMTYTARNIIANVWSGLFIAGIMCLFLPVTQGHGLDFVSPTGFWGQFAVAFVVSIAAPSILPFGSWSAAAARRLGAHEGAVAWPFVKSVFMTTLVFGVVGCAMELFIGGTVGLFDRWIRLVFGYWAFVYVVSIVADPIVMALTDACAKAFSFVNVPSQGEDAERA